MFSTKTKYVRTDAWRGYSQPVYAIFGWNDTGTAPDSPCNTDQGKKEGDMAGEFLKKSGFKFRIKTCLSSNVFCVHHYLIVQVEDYERAKTAAKAWYAMNRFNTRLLYIA